MSFFKRYGLLILLILLATFLRFYNLGYSEFQDDEKKAFIRKNETTSTFQFFMEQRKGPMQFLVTSATLLIKNEPRNELLIRFPFTVANLLSVIVFYLLLKELFDSDITAFLGGLIFSLNGFIVGFARIAQYQNLNILFSLLSLYFFIKLSKSARNSLLFSLLGAFFFSLSLLSHWDAVFFLVPIIFYYFKYLLDHKYSLKSKLIVSLVTLVFGCILLLPYLIPYTNSHLANRSNVEYFNRRVGLSNYSFTKHKFIFELYNPYMALYFLPLLGFIGIFNKKRGLLFLFWFIINLLLIRYLMVKPGTHIYNYVIPLIILASSGIHFLVRHKKLFASSIIPMLLLIGFLYYQSYILFLDHKNEYPWDKNEILNTKNIKLVTSPYKEKEVLTFGFPHYRSWKQVNEIVRNDPDNCTYISNEGKEITQIYMESKYGIMASRSCYYIADVKRPFITGADGAVFPQISRNRPVYIYEHQGEKLLKLYKISTN
jgi:hypothetical protein